MESILIIERKAIKITKVCNHQTDNMWFINLDGKLETIMIRWHGQLVETQEAIMIILLIF